LFGTLGFLEVALEVLERVLKPSLPPGPHQEGVEQSPHYGDRKAVLKCVFRSILIADSGRT
jgi:hypothetical protein